MLVNEALSNILGALYEAPVRPALWEQFLKLYTEAVGGESGALILHDSTNAESRVGCQWNVDPEATLRYEQHYGAVDVWRQHVAVAGDYLGTSEQLVPLAEMERTEIYNELFLPYRFPHGLFAIVEPGPVRIACFNVYRSQQTGAFDTEELELARFLKPHFKRAYQLHTQLTATRERSAGLQAALDTLSNGVILIDLQMRVISMNREAERITAASDGLLVGQAGVRAKHAGESARLGKLIYDAVTTSHSNGLNSAGAINISRREKPPVHVLVSPVRGIDVGERHPIRAILFINDPTQRVRPASQTLADLFGLTPAESRLAMLLADGRAPTEVTDILGVSRNTLKSQLASIYQKTGTSRQAQLVRLLLQLCAR